MTLGIVALVLIWNYVSNPFRELFSRARDNEMRAFVARAGFKPLSGIILARTLTTIKTRGAKVGKFQTPFGNHSRAHGIVVIEKNSEYQSFKPLSGIILARTQSLKGGKYALRRFQTPFGNHSRAHVIKGLKLGFGVILFQTPFGNYSRAHCRHPGQRSPPPRVSNPFRELFSRARARRLGTKSSRN